MNSAAPSGPSHAELARTALARATVAMVSCEAPGILRHLEHGHMTELVACAQAHGLRQAEWVTPSGLDRYGLKLLVFTAGGMTETRIAFPGGPVSSFGEVSASLRAVLACRCRACGHRPGWTPG
jgi:Protein of unknown function (DUF2470)